MVGSSLADFLKRDICSTPLNAHTVILQDEFLLLADPSSTQAPHFMQQRAVSFYVLFN